MYCFDIHCHLSAQMHHTPLDLARQHGHRTVVKLIENTAVKKVNDDCVSVSGDGVSVLAHMYM